MSVLVAGLIVFLAVHSIQIVAPELRASGMRTYGKRNWLLGYTGLSIIGFGLIVWGYGQARMDLLLLHSSSPPLRHVALLLLPVFPLLIAAYVPSRLQKTVRHPMLLATLLWGLAHLLANGTLPDLLLFGSFTVWAAMDWISASSRDKRSATQAPKGWRGDVLALLCGLALYGLFVGGLHEWLIGVAPL